MSKEDRLGIFISLILRHKPEEIGITLDKHGWANVEDLLAGMNKAGKKIDMKTLEEIVRTDNKQRYSFNSNKTAIRANQGHSVLVDVELKKAIPPNTLYHGTSTKNLNILKQQGIKSMRRLYVHLSKDEETGFNVGDRHGKAVVLVIDTGAMAADGIEFLLSVNGVWLTKYIDWKYVKEIRYDRCIDEE